mmetsp:Transcript_10987/g.17263  ORF Transcript_10987/g.17263 Transcript_10987/m.17263 type:complete len:228 (-) Transcript_10987:120-803(-)
MGFNQDSRTSTVGISLIPHQRDLVSVHGTQSSLCANTVLELDKATGFACRNSHVDYSSEVRKAIHQHRLVHTLIQASNEQSCILKVFGLWLSALSSTGRAREATTWPSRAAKAGLGRALLRTAFLGSLTATNLPGSKPITVHFLHRSPLLRLLGEPYESEPLGRARGLVHDYFRVLDRRVPLRECLHEHVVCHLGGQITHKDCIITPSSPDFHLPWHHASSTMGGPI